MMYTGIDIVFIPRFNSWLQYSPTQLATIFASTEITQLTKLLSQSTTDATQSIAMQFLASRFAAKEAFYKALSSACADKKSITPFTFRAIARHIEIHADSRWGSPRLFLDTKNFTAASGITLPRISSTISISHEKEYTIAHVLLTVKE
ncbi:MAG: 4'-phosphopantetheinyl transferase superfamily protein [bacterium]